MFLMISCGGGGEFIGGLRQKIKEHEDKVNKQSRTTLDSKLSEFLKRFSRGAIMVYVQPSKYWTDFITNESKKHMLADFEGYHLHTRYLKGKDPEAPYLSKREEYVILEFKGGRIGVLRQVRVADGSKSLAADPKKGEIDVLIPFSDPFDLEAGPWKLKALGFLVCKPVKDSEKPNSREIAAEYITNEINRAKESIKLFEDTPFMAKEREQKLERLKKLEKSFKIENGLRAIGDNKKEDEKLKLVAEQNRELDAQTSDQPGGYPVLNHYMEGLRNRDKLEDIESFVKEHNLEIKFNNSRAVADKALMNSQKMQQIDPKQKSQIVFAVYHYFFYTTVSDYLPKKIRGETNDILRKAGISPELRKEIWSEIRKVKNPEKKTAEAGIHFSTTRKLVVPAKDIEEGQEEICRTLSSIVMARVAGSGCLNGISGEEYTKNIAVLTVAIGGYFRATGSMGMDKAAQARFESLFRQDLRRNGIKQNVIDAVVDGIREIDLAKKNSKLEIV